MSASQAKRIAEVEQQNDQLRQLVEASTGQVRTVPGTSISITAQPYEIGSGRWAVFRHGFDERSVWTGERWESYSGTREWAHRWTTSDLVGGLLDRLVAQEMAAHVAWQSERIPSGIDEEFAEFASSEVAV